jgi:hypothetical protein
MPKSRFLMIALFVGCLCSRLAANTHAQSYYDMMAGIVQDGQSAEAQIRDAFNDSVRVEQNLYHQAMQNPNVQERYRQFLAGGGQASFPEFAAYYVRSAGGDPQTFQRYMRKQAGWNNQDRNAIFSTFDQLNRNNQEIHAERGRSMDYRNRALGEELPGTATYYNSWGSYQVPTTLTYGTWASDMHGNFFTADASGQPYHYTNWGWQPLYYSGR